jgi:hypothetical protein
MGGSLGEARCWQLPGRPTNEFMVRNSRVSCKGREESTPKAGSGGPNAVDKMPQTSPGKGSNGRSIEAELKGCTRQSARTPRRAVQSVFDGTRPPWRPNAGQASAADTELQRNDRESRFPSWSLGTRASGARRAGVCFFVRCTAKWGLARHTTLGPPGARRHCPTRCRCP